MATTFIETLQTQVSHVKTDLDALKKETSEENKKTKAETIEKDVTTTKEAINKKLEELKKLGEEKNKTDIAKLEAMLVTLDDSDKKLDVLKTEIITPIVTPKVDASATGIESVDNTADLATIKSNIVDMTAMAVELKTLVSTYEVAKKKWTAMENKAKEEDITTKKTALETKRKETQALIDKIRAAWKALKISDMIEWLPKTALEKAQAADETVLTADQAALDAIETPGRTLLEKVGDWANKIWKKISNWAEKAWDWAKENPKTAIAATAGVGLLIRWISKLFRKKKSSETSEKESEKKEKKWFRDHRYGKALKWWLIGTGVWYLGKWLLTGKWPRSEKDGTGADASDALSSSKEAAESFKELLKTDPAKAEKLNTVGTKVNDFYDDVYKFNDGTLPSDEKDSKLGEGKEKYVGAIPHILENTFSDVDTMESQKWFFTICTYQDWTEIKKQFATLIGNGCGKLVNSVLWLFGISWAITADNVSDKISTLVGWTNTLDEMHMVFRKILKVMSYTNDIENAYLSKYIETKVARWKPLYKKDADGEKVTVPFPTDAAEKEKLMIDIQYNYSEYQIGDEEVSTLKDAFRAKTLSEIYATDITAKDIFDYNYDVKDDVTKLNTKRDKTMIDLAKDQKGTLETLSASCGDEIADGFWENTKKLFPFLHVTEAFDKETAIKKTIKEDAWFKKMLEDFQKKFTELKSNTDITAVKKAIDNYYATLKELRTTQTSIVDMTNKDDNFLINAVTGVKNAFTGIPYCFQHGYKLIKEGSVIKGATWIYWGVSSIAVMGNITGLSNVWILSPIVKWTTYLTLAPLKATRKVVNVMFPKTYTMWHLANMVPTYVLRWYYTSVGEIQTWLTNGLSINKAFSLYKQIKGVAGQKPALFIDKVLWISNADDVARVQNIMFNESREITETGENFISEVLKKPSFVNRVIKKEGFDIASDLWLTLDKYESIAKIKNVTTATEDLGDITTLAKDFQSLYAKGDDVNTLAYKIVQSWWTTDANNAALYLSNTEQLAKGKAYAEEIIASNEWSIIEKATTKIWEAWNGAKTMFKEWIAKIKTLFTSNPKVPASMQEGMESEMTKMEAETEGVTEEALANPEKAENLAIFQKIFKNPIFKRILTMVPLLTSLAFTVRQAVGDFKEAAEIEKTNKERGEVKKDEAYFNVALWWVEVTIATLGIANVWNPGGWVILGITAGVEAVKYAGTKYYEVVNSYYRNFEDFKKMYMSAIKQEIISKEAWNSNFEISVQEKFQETVATVFGSWCKGDEKKVLSLATREDAIRALIWMEECENYPYATLSLDQFKWTDAESVKMQTEINTESAAMKADSVTRFNYIKEKYGTTFISKDKLITVQGKADLDKALLESRQYLAMTKDTTKAATTTDIATYQKERLATLKENTSFTKLEALYKSNPLQFHKIMKSLPYFSYLFQNQDPTVYANYETIKTNMEYVVKYYTYKTFWLLPSDIPKITIDWDQVDYTMMESFFLNFTMKPTGLTKDQLATGFSNNQLEMMTPDMVEQVENVSPSLWQNILYRIATEVLWWYTWGNTIDELKKFYSPQNKGSTWIYYEDGYRYVNNESRNRNPEAGLDQKIGTDEELNTPAKITLLYDKIKLASWYDKGVWITNEDNTRYSMITVDTKSGLPVVNKEYGIDMMKIIEEELVYRKPENVAKYKAEALAYVKENSDGKYIPLSVDLINKLTRAGVNNTGYYYYKWESSKLTALEAVKGAIPTFLVSKKCWLTDNIEKYTVKEVAYSTEVKTQVTEIDALVTRLSTTAALDDNDLNISSDIKKMVTAKALSWIELKTQLNHMDQTKAATLLSTQYDTYKTFFDNVYMMILHCASTGLSNDVDTYNDYISINSFANSELLKYTTEAWTTQVSVAIPDFEYTKEFTSTIATYKIPGLGKNKTVSDMLYSTDADEIKLGKAYAKEILKSILESALLEYDATGATANGVCNRGNMSVKKTLLAERLAINVKNVKEIKSTKTDATKVADTKVDDTKVDDTKVDDTKETK